MSHLPLFNGKILPITRWGTPILYRPVREVTSSDFDGDNLNELISDMFATMYAANGVGLAAKQVGVDLKVFVYDLTDLKGTRSCGVVYNPIIETPNDQDRDAKHPQHQHRSQRGMQSMTEGCLSYPGVSASVSRPRAITVRGIDQQGAPLEIHASGLLAQILQHEIDHLNGTVYGDYVSREVMERMDRKYKDLEGKKTYPEDWPISKAKHRWVI